MPTAYQIEELLECLTSEAPQTPDDVDFWYLGIISALEDRDQDGDRETLEAFKYLRWRKKWPQKIMMMHNSGAKFMMLFCKGHTVEDDPACWHSHATFPELTDLYNQQRLPCTYYISQRQFFAACIDFANCYPHLKPYLKPMEE